MAGVRIGYIVAGEKIMNLLDKVRFPNSVGTIPVEMANLALENTNWMFSIVDELISERERVTKELSAFQKFHIYPSSTNFLLIEVSERNSKNIMLKLMRRGIVIRSYQNQYMKNHIRITIRSPDQNDILLKTLKEIMYS